MGPFGGSLQHLLDGEEDIGEKEVPITSLLVNSSLQQPLQSLIKMLNEPICLGMVYGALHLLHLQQLAHIIGSWDIKGVPCSVSWFLGRPPQENSRTSSLATFLDVTFHRGIASW